MSNDDKKVTFNGAIFRKSIEEAEQKIQALVENRCTPTEAINSLSSVADMLIKADIQTLTDLEKAALAEIMNTLTVVTDTIKQIDEWIQLSPKIDTKTTLFANKLTAAELRLKAANLMSDIMLKLKELEQKAMAGNEAENIGFSYVEQMHEVFAKSDNLIAIDEPPSSDQETSDEDQ